MVYVPRIAKITRSFTKDEKKIIIPAVKGKGYNRKSKKKDINTNVISFMKTSRMTRMKFNSGVTLSTNGSTQYVFACAFRADSIYDPDYSNLGKNKAVQGWALANQLYKSYKVFGIKVSCKVYNTSTAPIVFTLGAGDSDSWASDYATSKKITDIKSRKGIKSIVIGPAGSSADMKTISYTLRPCDAIGVTKNTWADDASFGALMGYNPSNTLSRQPYVILCVGRYDDGLTSVGVQIELSISYVVRLFDPYDVTDQ